MKERESMIIIPESLEGYRETIAFGLTLKQFLLVSFGVVLLSLGAFSWSSGYWLVSLGLFLMVICGAFGAIEIEQRSLVLHLLSRWQFYRKAKVMVYHHFEHRREEVVVPKPASAVPGWILLSVGIGILSLLALTGIAYMIFIGLTG